MQWIVWLFILLLLTPSSVLFAGEPVPGAEVYVELEPDDEPVAHVITDENGAFRFVAVNNEHPFPKVGTFVFTVVPPKKFTSRSNTKISKMNKQKIRVKFNTLKDGPKFEYFLWWNQDRAENKGSFAVSGKNST